jgi:hypothetical protein
MTLLGALLGALLGTLRGTLLGTLLGALLGPLLGALALRSSAGTTPVICWPCPWTPCGC